VGVVVAAESAHAARRKIAIASAQQQRNQRLVISLLIAHLFKTLSRYAARHQAMRDGELTSRDGFKIGALPSFQRDSVQLLDPSAYLTSAPSSQ
jgi:hypothetical protein